MFKAPGVKQDKIEARHHWRSSNKWDEFIYVGMHKQTWLIAANVLAMGSCIIRPMSHPSAYGRTFQRQQEALSRQAHCMRAKRWTKTCFHSLRKSHRLCWPSPNATTLRVEISPASQGFYDIGDTCQKSIPSHMYNIVKHHWAKALGNLALLSGSFELSHIRKPRLVAKESRKVNLKILRRDRQVKT